MSGNHSIGLLSLNLTFPVYHKLLLKVTLGTGGGGRNRQCLAVMLPGRAEKVSLVRKWVLGMCWRWLWVTSLVVKFVGVWLIYDVVLLVVWTLNWPIIAYFKLPAVEPLKEQEKCCQLLISWLKNGQRRKYILMNRSTGTLEEDN